MLSADGTALLDTRCRLIRGAKRRLGLRGVLLPSAIFALALVATFAAGVASLALFAFGVTLGSPL